MLRSAMPVSSCRKSRLLSLCQRSQSAFRSALKHSALSWQRSTSRGTWRASAQGMRGHWRTEEVGEGYRRSQTHSPASCPPAAAGPLPPAGPRTLPGFGPASSGRSAEKHHHTSKVCPFPPSVHLRYCRKKSYWTPEVFSLRRPRESRQDDL